MLRWNHDSTIEKWTAATDVVKSEVFINKYISASKEISLFDNSEKKNSKFEGVYGCNCPSYKKVR